MRFEVIDPTQTGFFQVIDTRDRTGPWKEKAQAPGQPDIEHTYGGPTYTVAVFSHYCPNAGAEARELCQRLNGTMPPPPPQGKYGAGDFQVMDQAREVSVAYFSGKYCPNAQQEQQALIAKLNGE